jgi:tetratricopeptide (TPR) repeat protein
VATSNIGYFVATFVVGVLGFVVGNLALDAIKEQIHPSPAQLSAQAPSSSQAQSSAQPVLTVPVQSDLQALAVRPNLRASATPQSTLPGAAPLAAHPGLQPLEASGQASGQVRSQNTAISTDALAAAPESVGPHVSSGPAKVDSSASLKEIKHDEATAGRNHELAGWHFDRGIADGQRGSYDTAIWEFNEAIRLNPKLAGAFYCRGVTYWNKGIHDRAAADFNEAIRLDPKLAVAYYGRGCVYTSSGYKAEAEADFAHAKMLGYTSPKPASQNIIQTSLSFLRGAVP